MSVGGRDLGRKNTRELETWANKAGRGKERIWHEGTKTKQDTIQSLICWTSSAEISFAKNEKHVGILPEAAPSVALVYSTAEENSPRPAPWVDRALSKQMEGERTNKGHKETNSLLRALKGKIDR